MQTVISKQNKGVSLVSREAAEARRQHFLKTKSYWEQLKQKQGLHKVVKNTLLNMQELNKEFLVTPRALEKFFLLYLNKYHPSQQNIQRAINVARVYALLSHRYYQSAEKCNMQMSFFVSPSVWQKWLIGRKAKENSIKILQEMGLISAYRFNRNKYAPVEESRFVIMYQFVLSKVQWLHACVKTLIALEDDFQEGYFNYSFDDVTEDAFGYIEKVEDDKKYLL